MGVEVLVLVAVRNMLRRSKLGPNRGFVPGS